MSEPQAFALVAALGVLVTLGACYVHPRTRPYARKWGWLALVPLAFLAGVALLGGRRDDTPEGDGGAGAGEASKRAIRELADHAMAASTDADADLALRRLEAEATTDAARKDLAEFRGMVEEVRAQPDPAGRRANLIALVESTR